MTLVLLCFRFLASINRTLSPVAATAVRNVDVDVFPVLMIIMRSRSNTEIFTVIHGNIVVNELLTSLIQAVDVFQVKHIFIENSMVNIFYLKKKIIYCL